MIAAATDAALRAGLFRHLAGMSVLVVDDTVGNVALLHALLRDAGLERVAVETDARRVAGLLPVLRPDLVVLDLHMPHLDGYAVLEQVMEFAAGAYLPVLALTADSSTLARDRALAAGARDFLRLPFDVVEVLLRVANLLETRQLYTRASPPPRTPASGDVRSRTESAVREVLDTGAITPVFQPVVDLASGTQVGFEALARFTEPHPSGPAGWFADAFASDWAPNWSGWPPRRACRCSTWHRRTHSWR
jgi:CheY-like chemotaxis protein